MDLLQFPEKEIRAMLEPFPMLLKLGFFQRLETLRNEGNEEVEKREVDMWDVVKGMVNEGDALKRNDAAGR